jgi:DnaJ family protein A protein 2
VIKEKKVIEAQIDRGAPNGEKYIFHGEADEFPGVEAGDVVIVVQEQPHKLFKRKGADLMFEKEISLIEALTGVDFVITHLDGTKLRIKNKPGEVIKPDDIKTVDGKGMPYHKQTYKFGNLFIVFKIKFPETLNGEQAKKVNEALAFQVKKDKDEDMDIAETLILTAYSENQKNAHHGGGKQGRDSDEEEGEEDGSRQGVRC